MTVRFKVSDIIRKRFDSRKPIHMRDYHSFEFEIEVKTPSGTCTVTTEPMKREWLEQVDGITLFEIMHNQFSHAIELINNSVHYFSTLEEVKLYAASNCYKL